MGDGIESTTYLHTNIYDNRDALETVKQMKL